MDTANKIKIQDAPLKSVRYWLEHISKLVPEDKLDSIQSVGFVMILVGQDGPVSISNMPPELTRAVIEQTAVSEQKRQEYHGGRH